MDKILNLNFKDGNHSFYHRNLMKSKLGFKSLATSLTWTQINWVTIHVVHTYEIAWRLFSCLYSQSQNALHTKFSGKKDGGRGKRNPFHSIMKILFKKVVYLLIRCNKFSCLHHIYNTLILSLIIFYWMFKCTI